jgi:hypothetical protein
MTKPATETKQAREAQKPAAPFSFVRDVTDIPIVVGAIDPLRRGIVQ